MRKDTLIATCLAVSTKPSQSTNTPNWSLPNMLPLRRHQSNMVHRFRGWSSTPHNPSPQRRSNASKTLLVPSCNTMRERLTLTSCRTQHHCNTTKQRHTGSGWCMSPTPWLHCYTPQCRHLIRSVWHCTVRRTRPTFPNQVVKKSSRTFLFIQSLWQRLQQWRHTHPVYQHQTRNVVSIWSQTCHSLLRM